MPVDACVGDVRPQQSRSEPFLSDRDARSPLKARAEELFCLDPPRLSANGDAHACVVLLLFALG
jgi:hypothetical protein